MKRLCLYPLLLFALLKELEKADADADAAAGTTTGTAAAARGAVHSKLQATADAVQDMATQVNGMVAESENRVKMMELHERLRGLYPGLVSPTRRYVRTERVHVSKHAGGGSGASPTSAAPPPRKPYVLWLLTDRVLLTRPERISSAHLRIKADLPLTDLRVEFEAHVPASRSASPHSGA